MTGNDARTQFQEASRLFAEKKYAEALQILDALSASNPRNKDFLYPRALCLRHLGRTTEASTLCQELVEQHGDERASKILKELEDETASAQSLSPGVPGLDDILSERGLAETLPPLHAAVATGDLADLSIDTEPSPLALVLGQLGGSAGTLIGALCAFTHAGLWGAIRGGAGPAGMMGKFLPKLFSNIHWFVLFTAIGGVVGGLLAYSVGSTIARPTLPKLTAAVLVLVLLGVGIALLPDKPPDVPPSSPETARGRKADQPAGWERFPHRPSLSKEEMRKKNELARKLAPFDGEIQEYLSILAKSDTTLLRLDQGSRAFRIPDVEQSPAVPLAGRQRRAIVIELKLKSASDSRTAFWDASVDGELWSMLPERMRADTPLAADTIVFGYRYWPSSLPSPGSASSGRFPVTSEHRTPKYTFAVVDLVSGKCLREHGLKGQPWRRTGEQGRQTDIEEELQSVAEYLATLLTGGGPREAASGGRTLLAEVTLRGKMGESASFSVTPLDEPGDETTVTIEKGDSLVGQWALVEITARPSAAVLKHSATEESVTMSRGKTVQLHR